MNIRFNAKTTQTTQELKTVQRISQVKEKKVSNAMLDFLFDTKLPIYNNIKYLSDMNINLTTK